MSPDTPMESGGDWATLEEESAFLAEVIAESAHLTRLNFGTSAGGHYIYGWRVALPSSPDVGDLLLVLSQHGDEPAPREAGLRLVRDLSSTNDPGTLARLNERAVTIVPTANPDGIVANTRQNADGVDTNRTHLTLTSPESLALATLIQRLRPTYIFDGHEQSNNTIDFKAYDYEAAPSLVALGQAIVGELKALIPSAGDFGVTNSPETLVASTNFRGTPTLIAESNMSLAAEGRVANQLTTMMHLVARGANDAAVAQVSAQEHLRSDGYNAVGVWLDHYSGARPIRSACGYVIHGDMTNAQRRHLMLFDIQAVPARPDGGSTYIPCETPSSMAVRTLFDPLSANAIVSSETVYYESPTPVVRLAGVERVDVRHPRMEVRRLVTADGWLWGR